MPLLLHPEDCALWLEGGSLLALGPAFAADEFYRENLAERWSTGRPDLDATPHGLASSSTK
ncbi:hypothetical protein [Sphingomonas soli]|uniref:hypothetical protein n=1 Tax=Sphingomonas soli TaxID=266127 RepID=UPI00082FA99F|nr:hypothetical protein [Sphingomonas soli]